MGASLLSGADIVPQTLGVGDSVVPNDKPYFKHTKSDGTVEYIYTQKNLPFAKHAAAIEDNLHTDYRNYFDWKLDETLYVGLISDNNQIANGFSTQWPNNRQINYVGGAMAVDYFCSTSWLDTLLFHETAHNYQLNLKANSVSQGLHSIFGNGSFLLPLPLITPNIMENSFMIEGNAVLNESWHGNGGRLYSGRFKAQTILQAKAGNIIAGDVYNSKLAFPYGNIVYIQGGFFNYYMASKYGLKNINSYFKEHSKDFLWPQFTNASMQNAVGVDFETSVENFANEYKKLGENFVEVEGEHLFSSQFLSGLSSSKDEIFFITNESGTRAPELNIIDKKSKKIQKSRDSWISGKVLNVDGKYYTQGSQKTSVTKIRQGLFGSDRFIKEGSASKVVQAYLSDGVEVYFDVASSYSEPQLYVGKDFYAQVNSSVIVDKDDNLYYFKQKGKTRTLYKNRIPLYSYEGFYGIVSDVDSEGRVYFIANSELGSTLYAYNNSQVTRVSSADNIVDARLINDSELLLAAISEKDYYYVLNVVKSINQEPFETELFFEDKEYYGAYKKSLSAASTLDTSESYNSFFDMHYSGSDFVIGKTVDDAIIGNINIKFADPLSQNSASLFVSRDDSNVTIAGASYASALYLLNYSLTAYGVVDDDGREDTRDSGFIVEANLPFYEAGIYSGVLGASYFQDYDSAEREPLSVTFNIAAYEQYGVSMYANYLNMLTLYGVIERDDKIVGGKYAFKHDLPYEFYFGFGAKYSKTDSSSGFGDRGVKITTSAYSLDMDPSTIDMPSLGYSAYVKNAGYGEVSLAKVFNFSSYFFTFPISLQRESFYTKYRHYEIEAYSTTKYKADEITTGLTLSTVFLNSFTLPLSIEYIYSDADFVKDKNSVRVLLGASF
jgi:hypothetical protein